MLFSAWDTMRAAFPDHKCGLERRTAVQVAISRAFASGGYLKRYTDTDNSSKFTSARILAKSNVVHAPVTLH
jgi:hypothetical protein